jgi:prophage maintenance system killer protein
VDKPITTEEAERLTLLYISLYYELRKRYEAETGIPVKEYKRLEPEKIRRFFREFSTWRASVYNAASLMISKLLVIHPLPNMNHRTSITWTILFFRANDVVFPRYDVVQEKERYKSDCVQLIERSKPLLRAKPKKRDEHLRMSKEWIKAMLGRPVQSGRLARISPVATSLRMLIAHIESAGDSGSRTMNHT